MFEIEFWIGLATIVMIDLVLAGDNAVVIAMASRKLPKEQRNKAILWGAFGAIIIRILMTLGAVWLLKIPFLQAIGGLLLLVVAVKLLKDEGDAETIQAQSNLLQAIRTIIIADVIMGVDNVLAIAGASQGNMALVVIGLAISIPIIVWGSKWIVAWMDRFPIIIFMGAIVLAWTAGSMIVHDRIVGSLIASVSPMFSWAIYAIAIGIVSVCAWTRRKSRPTRQKPDVPKAI